MLNIACALLVELMLIGVLEFEELGNKIAKDHLVEKQTV